ncbi:MAG TPA: hypothetical protein PKD85_07370, partial [Saprospiraceae bacterium]|nr:hypothetical protein [Saprospiraceae bacterium]
DTTQKLVTIKAFTKDTDTTSIFKWTLPDGSIHEEVILNLKNENTIFGKYSLEVANGSCISNRGSILIEQDTTVRTIDLQAPTAFCGLDTLLIKTQDGFESYRFFVNQRVVEQNNTGRFLYIPNQNDSLLIKVEAFQGSCLKGTSKILAIIPKEKPLPPVIKAEKLNICLADSLKLDILSPDSQLEYLWYLPIGQTKVSTAMHIIDIPNNLEGAYRVAAKLGTCISDLSDSVFVTVKPRILIPKITGSLPSICEDGTSRLKFCLTDIPADPLVSFVIEQLPSRKIWVEGRDSCFDRPSSTLESSTNRLRLYATKEGCTSDEFFDANISYTVQPDIKANIIADALAICEDTDSIKLNNATPIDTLQVIWRVFSNAKLKVLPGNEISLSNLSRGLNRVILTISYLNCRNFSMDTIDLIDS